MSMSACDWSKIRMYHVETLPGRLAMPESDDADDRNPTLPGLSACGCVGANVQACVEEVDVSKVQVQ